MILKSEGGPYSVFLCSLKMFSHIIDNFLSVSDAHQANKMDSKNNENEFYNYDF